MSMPEEQLRLQDSASREDLFNIALTATVHLLPKLFQNVFEKCAQDLSQTRGTLFALRFSPALQTRVSRTRHGHHRFERRVRLDDLAELLSALFCFSTSKMKNSSSFFGG